MHKPAYLHVVGWDYYVVSESDIEAKGGIGKRSLHRFSFGTEFASAAVTCSFGFMSQAFFLCWHQENARGGGPSKGCHALDLRVRVRLYMHR